MNVSTKVKERRKANLGNLAVSLPTELLSDVFIRLVEGEIPSTSIKTNHDALISARRARFTLCGVCHIWRETAISTKQIWTIIDFPHGVRTSFGRKRIESVSLLQDCLQRSDQMPLSLYLFGAAAKGKFSQSMIEAVSNIVEPLISLCGHIQLDIDAIQVQKLFRHPLQLPNLRSLVATVKQSPVTHLHTLDLTFASQLRHLAVFNSPSPTFLKLKLGVDLLLTRLTLQGTFYSSSIVTVLQNCPRLEYLLWQQLQADLPISNLPPTVYMASLHDITVSGSSPLSVLGHLDAPQLARLQFVHPTSTIAMHNLGTYPLSNTSRFPMLQTLLLLGRTEVVHVDDEIIARFVEAHPHLETLCLHTQLTERMSQAIASIPALRNVKAIPPRPPPVPEFDDYITRWGRGEH
ncbi:hypothetical protein DL93DRAFT_2084924 [Clavulina sp. PMI_390]|nr:hypothetical protein DL93DRAFT_2084924 [Clavulina sp. PMI_390]